MKPLYSIICAVLFSCNMCLSFAEEKNDKTLERWVEGFMDIHHISTGQGDCVFFVLPDGTTWMIDAGDLGLPNGSGSWSRVIPDSRKSPGQYICDYIRQFSPSPEYIDYVLLTHFHSDHIGSPKNAKKSENGYALSGLLEVGENISFGKLVDRGWPDYDFPSRKKITAECGILEDYFKFTEYQRGQGMGMEKFVIGSKKQFALKYNPRKYKGMFEVRNLCANAQVWIGKGLKTKPMYSGDIELFDENMNSCGVLVRYGDFTYYNCGDIPGGNFPRYKSLERNFESYVADVCGKITVMKCDHHAATDAVNSKLMLKADPEAFIILASHREHPYKSTMLRMTDPFLNYPHKKEFYITSEASKKELGEELWSWFKPAGHIVIRVSPGGKQYRIFSLDIFSGNYRIIYDSGPKDCH